MKQLVTLLVTLLVAVPMALGLLAGFAYHGTDDDVVPRPTVTAMETRLALRDYTWQEPVMAGLVRRDFSATCTDDYQDLGTFTEPGLTLACPEGYTSTATILFGDVPVWQGAAEDIAEAVLLEDGEYRLEVVCTRAENGGRANGELHYAAVFTMEIEPYVEVNTKRVQQGDVLAIQVHNLAGDMMPTATSSLGMPIFTPAGSGKAVAYLAVGYDCEPGHYTVEVACGNQRWELPLQVSPALYAYLTEGVDIPRAPGGEAADEAAMAEYAETIPPLYTESEAIRHWTGQFIMPVENGEVTASYGARIYASENTRDFTRHDGVDISADDGAAVSAPATGRVIFAGELAHTGNTIIIDHGGGVKSYLYHLKFLNVRTGENTFVGNFIALAGSTGNAAQPHLHYEVRIGEVPINPELLFNGSSGLYVFSYNNG